MDFYTDLFTIDLYRFQYLWSNLQFYKIFVGSVSKWHRARLVNSSATFKCNVFIIVLLLNNCLNQKTQPVNIIIHNVPD